MKTILELASGIVLMIVMYFYFIAVSLFALVTLPFVKLGEFIKNNAAINKVKDPINQVAGI